jgi:SagB-type dehydrogenase family enzyme
MKGIGKEFMEKTRYEFAEPSDQERRLPQPPLALRPAAGQALIDLPDASSLKAAPVDLRALITARRTLREYAPDPLSLAEISYLLWCTQGVKEMTPRPATLRTVPSAGARHAFETCLLANRVTGLKPGLYRFFAIEHKLAEVDTSPGVARTLAAAALEQSHVEECAAAFLWTALTYRMKWRYGERGYRYLHLDAGHVCQNLALAAEALHCGICPIAAFDDTAINAALGLDGEEQFLIYMATVGRRS